MAQNLLHEGLGSSVWPRLSTKNTSRVADQFFLTWQSVRVQVYFCLVRARVARSWWPGPGGPVPVARLRWRSPVLFCPDPCRLSCPWSGFGGPVARSRSRLLSQSRSALLWWRWPVPVPVPVVAPTGPGDRVPVPIKRITYAVWPASMSPGMDAQSLPGIWLFHAVLQTTGERQTMLRSRNHYRTKTGAKRLPQPTA